MGYYVTVKSEHTVGINMDEPQKQDVEQKMYVKVRYAKLTNVIVQAFIRNG